VICHASCHDERCRACEERESLEGRGESSAFGGEKK
jgi:hypothetical protein